MNDEDNDRQGRITQDHVCTYKIIQIGDASESLLISVMSLCAIPEAWWLKLERSTTGTVRNNCSIFGGRISYLVPKNVKLQKQATRIRKQAEQVETSE